MSDKVLVYLEWNWFNDTMGWDVRPADSDRTKADFEAVHEGVQNELWLVSENTPDKIMEAMRKLFQAWQERPDVAARILERQRRLAIMSNNEGKHGHWIRWPDDRQRPEDVQNRNYQYECSLCHASDLHAERADVKYCWKCGARMDEKESKND